MSSITKKKGRDSGESQSPEPQAQSQTAQESLWPEWSDAEVNSEKWGNPIVAAKPDKKGGKKPSPKGDKKSAKSDKTGATKDTTATIKAEKFEDQYEVPLPWSIRPLHYFLWQRPEDMVDPNVKLVVFSPTSPSLPDLITKNRNLFRSSCMRSIVSAIYMLCYIGQTKPFIVEWQTPFFQSNTDGQAWKPWFHIYSIGKAGKGQTHNPLANTLGKYVVRLYWLGCWRKFIVDDRCPKDEKGQHLIPLSYVEGEKELELWPILITKALLKVASLTWTPDREIVDFDVVTCLTGWPVQKVHTKGMDPQDVWEMCCGYSMHFDWDMNIILKPPEEIKPELASEKSSKAASTKASTKGSKKDKSSTKATKSVQVDAGCSKRFYLAATCSDLREFKENDIEDITPCFEHDFLIEETRNIPLIDKVPEYDRNIARWKEYRWVDWAVEHGLWDKVYDWEIYKCMRIVSSMRKMNESESYNLEMSETGNFIEHSAKIIEEFVERKLQEKLADAKKKGGKEKSTTPKSPKSPTKKTKQMPFVDPSIWSDFAKIAPYITCVSIYLKPSCFKVSYIVSDIPFNGVDSDSKKKTAKKDDKKMKGGDEGSVRHIYWENKLVKSRNDTVYLFTDSIDFKLTIFSLAHLGNDLPKPATKLEEVEHESKCDMLICKKGKCETVLCTCQKDPSLGTIPEETYCDSRKYAYMMIQNYKWETSKIEEVSTFLRTCGSKSILIDLEKGRHMKRLWIDSESPYVLLILCDTEMKVGKLDEILECMETESELITLSCYNICSTFGNLIRYFGFPEYNTASKEFYKSYIPPIRLSKTQMSLIHNTFQEELIKVLINLFPPDKYYHLSRAFKILFLNPFFRIPYELNWKNVETVSTKNVREDCLCDDIDFIKLQQYSAIKLQAYFKMLYIKRLKSLHNPQNKNFQPVLEILKQVFQNVFSSKVRNVNKDLLRNFILNEKLESIVRYYPFYKDLDLVVDLKQFSGEILDPVENDWVPLVRRIFFCETTDLITIRAYIFCSLTLYVLRIINNDTGMETERYTNTPLVSKYKRNEKGYTVLGYGWTNDNPEKSISWKLYLVIEKKPGSCPVVCQNVINVPQKIKGNYIPNKDNLVAKFTVKFYESCLGTFYFQANSPETKIKIKCLNDTGETIFEATGKSSVLIPVVKLQKSELEGSRRTSSDSQLTRKKSLKSRTESTKRRKASMEKKSHTLSVRKSKLPINSNLDLGTSVEYSLQVNVLDNSWPLTTSEWEFVHELKTKRLIKKEINLSNLSLSEDEMDKLLGSKQNLFPEEKSVSLKNSEDKTPNWILINFTESVNGCVVETDERRIEEIKNIKRSLFVDNIPRYAEGQILRSDFLQDHYIQWESGPSDMFLEIGDFRSVSMALSSGVFHVTQHKIADEFRRKLSEDIRNLAGELKIRMSEGGSVITDEQFIRRLTNTFEGVDILKTFAENCLEQNKDARSASVMLGSKKFHVKELQLLSDFSKRLSQDIKQLGDLGFVTRMSYFDATPQTGLRSASMQVAPGMFHVKQFQLPEDFTELDNLDRAIAEGAKYKEIRSVSQAVPAGIYSTKQLKLTPEIYKDMEEDLADENLINLRKLSLEFEDPDPTGPRSASFAVPSGTYHVKQRQIDASEKDSNVIPENLLSKPKPEETPMEIIGKLRSASQAVQPTVFHVKQKQLNQEERNQMSTDLESTSKQLMTILDDTEDTREEILRSASTVLPENTFHIKQYQTIPESADDTLGISLNSLPFEPRLSDNATDDSIRSISMAIPTDAHLFHILQLLQKHIQVEFCAMCNQSLSEENIKYIRQPDTLSKMLPPFDLNECDDEKDRKRRLVRPDDAQKILEDIDKKMNEFDENYDEFLTDMECFNEERKQRNQFLLDWYQEIRNNSAEINKNAETRRQGLVSKLKEANAVNTKGKKGKK